MRNPRVVALVVAPPVGVACGYAVLFVVHWYAGFVSALLLFVLVPAAIARRAAFRLPPGERSSLGLPVAAAAIALVEAFVVLVFLLSRANFG